MGLGPSSLDSRLGKMSVMAMKFEVQSRMSSTRAEQSRNDARNCHLQGNMDMVRVHASHCVRHKNQADVFSKLSQRVRTLHDELLMSKEMSGVSTELCNLIESVDVKSLNAQALHKSLTTMELMNEKCAEVQDALVDSAQPMESYEVDSLVKQLAEESLMEQELRLMAMEVPTAQLKSTGLVQRVPSLNNSKSPKPP